MRFVNESDEVKTKHEQLPMMSMATRDPTGVSHPTLGKHTEFQLHVGGRGTFDLTLARLRRLVTWTFSSDERQQLESVLKRYLAGNIAVAWRDGQPIWIPVTRE